MRNIATPSFLSVVISVVCSLALFTGCSGMPSSGDMKVAAEKDETVNLSVFKNFTLKGVSSVISEEMASSIESLLSEQFRNAGLRQAAHIAQLDVVYGLGGDIDKMDIIPGSDMGFESLKNLSSDSLVVMAKHTLTRRPLWVGTANGIDVTNPQNVTSAITEMFKSYGK